MQQGTYSKGYVKILDLNDWRQYLTFFQKIRRCFEDAGQKTWRVQDKEDNYSFIMA